MADNQDPFAAYGGQAVAAQEDPFKAYGGSAATPASDDPFKAYGGQAAAVSADNTDPLGDARTAVVKTGLRAAFPLAAGAYDLLASRDPQVTPEQRSPLPAKVQDEPGLELPPEQKALNAVNTVANGYYTAEMGVGLIKAVPKIASIAYNTYEAVKNIPTAIKMGRLAQIEKLAGKISPESDTVIRGMLPEQMSLPLSGEAEQPRLFDLLPKPVKVGVEQVAEEFAKKYGSKSHIKEFLKIATEKYAQNPADAEAFIKDIAQKNSNTPTTMGGWFPDQKIGAMFAEELIGKLKADPLLQPEILQQLQLAPGSPRPPNPLGLTLITSNTKPGDLDMAKQIAENTAVGRAMAATEHMVPPKPVERPFTLDEAGKPTSPIRPSEQVAVQGSLGLDIPSNAQVEAAKFRSSPQGQLQEAIDTKQMPEPFLPGGVQRVAKISDAAQAGDVPDVGQGIVGGNTRANMDVALGGKRDSVWYQQRMAMAAQSEKARNATYDSITAIDKLGIKPNSSESYAVKVYVGAANKEVAYQGLVSEFGKAGADRIVNVSKALRPEFDKYWLEVNKTRIANGVEPIPYQADYITQGSEWGMLHDLGILDKGELGKVKEQIQIIRDAKRAINAEPNMSRMSNVVFNFKRLIGGEDNLDAITAFRKYVASANNVIHMQPVVNELNATAKAVQKVAPRTATYMAKQASYLAGGVPELDGGLTSSTSSTFVRLYTKATQNMIGNIVGLNPRIAYSQLMGTIPTFAEYPVRDFVSGGAKVVANGELRDFALANSPTLRDRMNDLRDRNVDAGLIRKSSNAMIGFSDAYVAMHSWITAYTSALRSGIPTAEAIAEAENFTARAQGFTNRVNTSPLLRSKTVQSFIPLQNQSMAFAKYITHDLWEGKTVTQATLPAFKLAIAAATAAYGDYLIFGKMGGGIVQLTDFVPLGGVSRHGIGGPVVGSLGRIANAANSGDFKKTAIETAKAGLLVQPYVPGGLQISKGLQALYDYSQGQ